MAANNDSMAKVKSWSTGDDRHLMQRASASNTLLVRTASYSDSWGVIESWGVDDEEPLISNWQADSNGQSSSDSDDQVPSSQDSSTSSADIESWQSNSHPSQEYTNESSRTFSFFSRLDGIGADGTTCYVPNCDICNRAPEEPVLESLSPDHDSPSQTSLNPYTQDGVGDASQESQKDSQRQPKTKQARTFFGIMFRSPNWRKFRSRLSGSPKQRLASSTSSKTHLPSSDEASLRRLVVPDDQ